MSFIGDALHAAGTIVSAGAHALFGHWQPGAR